MWTLIDHTKATGGYMTIALDGKRVADVFPFARDSDPEWVRQQAQRIVDRMNSEKA